MNKWYRIIRGAAALTVGVLCAAALVGLWYPIKIFDLQFTALAQRVLVDFSLFAAVLLGLVLLITLLCGRIYCSTLCPLGVGQELLMLLLRRKVEVQRNRPYKYFLAALVFGALLGGTACLVRLIDPYTLFGSAVSGAWLGGIFAVLLAVLVWFKGRLFCANICPVGAILGLIAKHAVNKVYIEEDKCLSCGLCAKKCPVGCIDFKNKKVDNEMCLKCFKCLGVCRRGGVHFGRQKVKAPSTPFSPQRRKLLVGGAALALLAVSVKSGVKLAQATAAKLKKAILPAGAGSQAAFANRCLNCNLCVQNCPMKVLKKAEGDYKTVHLDYENSFCNYDCHKCSEVCPSGAIRRLSLAEKQKTQIGIAQIDTEVCVKCGLCVMKCPRQAISKEEGAFPIVDDNICIGCGACQNACPVKAIKIMPVEQQKTLA